jgi:hypothetical protein
MRLQWCECAMQVIIVSCVMRGRIIVVGVDARWDVKMGKASN